MDICLFGKSIVIVALVEDARCILESAVGSINCLSADHRLDTNEEELINRSHVMHSFCGVIEYNFKFVTIYLLYIMLSNRRERVSECSGEVGQLNNGGGLFSLPVLIYQPCVIIICHLRLLRLICDSIIPIRRYALFQPAVIFRVQRSAISEAKREDICKHGIEIYKIDIGIFYFNVDILILGIAPLKKEEEDAVKKKYSLANPISFSGPTGADIHRNALFRKLLMKSGVYESAKEIAKREEILLRIEQWKLYGIRPGSETALPIRQVDVIISFLSSRKDLRVNEEVVSKENRDSVDVECRKLLVSWVRGTAVTDKRVKMFEFYEGFESSRSEAVLQLGVYALQVYQASGLGPHYYSGFWAQPVNNGP
ncbi:nuclear poly(A) polymerase 4-like protein [Tanacetum coccineum]